MAAIATRPRVLTSEGDKKRAEAIASMNAGLRARFEEIETKTREIASKNIAYYYWLGGEADDIRGEETTYGEGAVEKMAAALSYDLRNLWKYIVFHSQYNKAELASIARQGEENDHVITVSHFFQLLTIDDKQQRLELIQDAISNKMSIRELSDAVKRRQHIATGSGRAVAPRTVMGGLSQMGTMTDRLMEKYLGDFKTVVFDHLAEVTDSEVTEDLLARVEEIEKIVHKLADLSDSKARELEKIKKELQAANQRNAKRLEDAKKPPAEPEPQKPPGKERVLRPIEAG